MPSSHTSLRSTSNTDAITTRRRKSNTITSVGMTEDQLLQQPLSSQVTMKQPSAKTTSQAPMTLEKALRIERNKFKRRCSDDGYIMSPEDSKEVETYPLVPTPSLISSEQHRDDAICRNDLVHRHLKHLQDHHDGSDVVQQSGQMPPPVLPIEEDVSPPLCTSTAIGKSSSSFSSDVNPFLERIRFYGLFALLAVACVSLLPSSLQNGSGDANVSGITGLNELKVYSHSTNDPVSHTLVPKIIHHHNRPEGMLSTDNPELKEQQIPSQSLHNVNREAIINGNDVTDSHEKYPYVVSLLQKNWKRQAWHTCGGTLITPNVILTAAHCHAAVDIAHIGATQADHYARSRNLRAEAETETVEEDDDLLLKEASGSTLSKRDLEVHINNRSNGGNGKAYEIRPWDKVVHPEYNRRTAEYDIMLVKIPVWNDNVETAKLNDDNLVPNGQNYDPATVLGWGVTLASDGHSVSEILQHAELSSLTNNACNSKYQTLFGASVISDDMLCAHSESGKDACRGDSGGPLLKEDRNDPSKNIVIGVVSWGEECGHSDYPGVYSRLSTSHDWITDTVCNVLSPESCTNGRIKQEQDASRTTDDGKCKDHVGLFENSRYRNCDWVGKRKRFGCFFYKDMCPKTCDVREC